jgi:hypothetical protein
MALQFCEYFLGNIGRLENGDTVFCKELPVHHRYFRSGQESRRHHPFRLSWRDRRFVIIPHVIRIQLSVLETFGDNLIGFVRGISYESIFLLSSFLQDKNLSQARIFFSKRPSFNRPLADIYRHVVSEFFFDGIEKRDGESQQKRLIPPDHDEELVVI